jgi:hypothetical protein
LLSYTEDTNSNELFFMPTRQQVADLKVGDLAPDWAGRMMPVVEITAP